MPSPTRAICSGTRDVSVSNVVTCEFNGSDQMLSVF